MKATPITVLFVPLDGFGHFNPCIGLAEPLRDRGHKVVFAVPVGWRGKLKALGFEEEWYSVHEDLDEDRNAASAASAELAEVIKSLASGMSKPPLEQIKGFILPCFGVTMVKMARIGDESLKSIIDKIKPDVIVQDSLMCQPSIVTAGIPWILSSSPNPVGITKEDSPPCFSGLSIEGNREEWKQFVETMDTEYEETFLKFNNWVISKGAEPLVRNFPYLWNPSPYANIYMYPKELDYVSHRPTPPSWFQFDTFVRSSTFEFEIPEILKDLPGKLVFISMGSLGSSDAELMKRLLGILGRSPHRFIVSKGANGDEYEVPGNMWGANMVPQTAVIPMVDLVITHGGNNTVTESFYFGKPCIVLPLYCDQHDNAQRIEELGLGLKFRPYQVTEDELLPGIEKILGDQELAEKMKMISNRIQASNSQSRAADLIEKVALSGKKINGKI